MFFLIINSGSSSLRFQLLDEKSLECFYKGHVDEIGLKTCIYREHGKFGKREKKIICKNHKSALEISLKFLQESKVVKSLKEIKAVGHRVVHGGEIFKNPTIITSKNLNELKKLNNLAPLHNPANIEGIEAAQKLLKGIKNIAVFDTAFYKTLNEKAFLYAIPLDFYKKYKIRKYGFHGTSHQYVSETAIKHLKSKKFPYSKIITCHLGNGSSISAVLDGKAIDTSMGFTPLEGIPMGTRSGDIDPAIIEFLYKEKNYELEQIFEILNHKSGIKGISGISSDVRTLRDKWFKEKNKSAKLAMDIFCYKIAKYIGSYTSALNGLDCVVFTGGIGEHAWYIREWICDYFKFLGLKIDNQKNKKDSFEITKKDSKIKVLIIPTNEEKQIAIELKKNI